MLTRTCCFAWLLLSASVLRSEDVPLERCDSLPAVSVTVSGNRFLFLVDTAATSMLNLESFSHGAQKAIHVTSWSGTAEAQGREVELDDITIGDHRFKHLRLHAIDLSRLGRACGRKIDGVLGVDLLEALGAEIDLKNRVAHLEPTAEATKKEVAEFNHQLEACTASFNRAEELKFADCVDQHVVVTSSSEEYLGREAAMGYFRQAFFSQHPQSELSLTPRAHQLVGSVLWLEYELRIHNEDQVGAARGTAIYHKVQGKWRMLSMNYPVVTRPLAYTENQ